MVTVKIVQDNIVKIPVDVIVNAANSSLLGGGGVDGAIHRASGPKLLFACMKLGGCKIGEAKITQAYGIKTAKYIVHTVGPVYKSKKNKEEAEQQLIACFRNSLLLAETHRTVAFPFISTGVYGYPLEKAIPTYIQAIKEYFISHPQSTIDEVILVAYNKTEYEKALEYSEGML